MTIRLFVRLALSSLLLAATGSGALAESQPATGAPPASTGQPAFDNNDELLFSPDDQIPDAGPVQPPTLPDRPAPQAGATVPIVPGDGAISPPRPAKPTLAWRARVQKLSSNGSPPVVRTTAGSLAGFFPSLVKACGDAGFEVRGNNGVGELWVRRNYADETAVRCNLYFSATENPVGRVIVKCCSDKNSAAELRAANLILDTCTSLEAGSNEN
jgi:hypothetical protein